MQPSVTCLVCRLPVLVSWNFCPNCGNSLRGKSLSTSFLKQLGIYAVSFFLPPFGLGSAFKYLRQNDSKAKTIGIISIILTVLSILSIFLAFKGFMDYYSKILNSVSSGSYPY